MLKFRGLMLVFLAALLGVLSAYQYAQACVQDCDLIRTSCRTDGAGNCQANKCYWYTPAGTSSCWTCGAGAPGAGWCILGDANLKCVGTSATINYKVYQSCTRSCNKANAYVEAGSVGDPTSTTGTEQQFTCTVK
jgi:hypothetical protein